MKKIVIVGALLCLTSCQSASVVPPATESGATQAISKAAVVVDQTITEQNDFYNIEAVVPGEAWDTERVMAKFVQDKVNEKKEAWKIGGTIYNEEQATAKEFPDRPKITYTYDINYQKYESKKLGTVSYVLTAYEYSGGANGNSTIYTFSFNKQGWLAVDRVLNFDNDRDIALTKLLAEHARQGDYASDMLEEGLGLAYLKEDGRTLDREKCHCDGFFFGSNFQNFALTDTGMTFIFSEYQIAPGAAGTPALALDWPVLKPYLTSEYQSVVE